MFFNDDTYEVVQNKLREDQTGCFLMIIWSGRGGHFIGTDGTALKCEKTVLNWAKTRLK